MTVVRGIDHIGLTVPDLDQAQAYFEAVFGAAKLYDLLVDPVTGPEMAVDLGVPNGTVLEAIRVISLGDGPGIEMFKYSAPDQREALRACDIGTQHFAVFVDDIPTILERIRANGGRIHGEVKDLPFLEAGPGNRYIYTSPPWGGIIELVQIPSPQAYENHTESRRWQPGRGRSR